MKPAEFVTMTNGDGHTVTVHPIDVKDLERCGYVREGEAPAESPSVMTAKDLQPVPARRGRR